MRDKKHQLLSDIFRGLNENAKKALATGYVLKNTDFTDERWERTYQDWLQSTDSEVGCKGIDEFRTMSWTCWERSRTDNDDILKKGWLDHAVEAKMEEFTRGINR